METVRLPVGKQAPIDTDCIRVEHLADREYRLTASALCTGESDSESVSIIGHPTFENAEQAEAAGIEWARSVGVTQLMISTGTLKQPLQLLEIDKPL